MHGCTSPWFAIRCADQHDSPEPTVGREASSDAFFEEPEVLDDEREVPKPTARTEARAASPTESATSRIDDALSVIDERIAHATATTVLEDTVDEGGSAPVDADSDFE